MRIIIKDEPDNEWRLDIAPDDPRSDALIAAWITHVVRQYTPAAPGPIPRRLIVEIW